LEKLQHKIRIASLKGLGIATASQLIEASVSPEKRRAIAAQLGIGEERIERWLDLAYPNRTSPVATEVAKLLEHGGFVVLKPVMQRTERKPRRP